MRLHEQVKHQASIIEAYEEILHSLERYLALPKFEEDISVNKNDILLRIQEGKTDIIRTYL